MNLSEIKNVLIIRLSSLGDILLTTPLIRSLKEQNDSINIDFVLREQYSDLLKFNPNIDRLFIYSNDADKKIILFSDLQKRNYDLVIDLQNNFRSAEIRRKLKVKSVRFYKRTFDKFLLVKFKINRLSDAPQIPVRYAGSLPGLKLDEKGLDLYLPANINSVLNMNEKYIGIAPGSRHYTKMWLKEYYIDLCKILSYDGYKIVLFGGTSDRDLCKELAEQITGSINLCSEDDIIATTVNMKKCSAIICNDSGLMHAASAAGVPVLAVFGSTVKEFGFTPYGGRNLILENKLLSCRPCTHIGRDSCPKKHFNCMTELTPDVAYIKLKELLS